MRLNVNNEPYYCDIEKATRGQDRVKIIQKLLASIINGTEYKEKWYKLLQGGKDGV